MATLAGTDFNRDDPQPVRKAAPEASVPVEPIEEKAPQTRPEPRTRPTPAVGAASIGRLPPARSNIQMLRYWADHSEWIRAVIDRRREQVGCTDWDVVPIEPGDPYDEKLKAQILTSLVFPNSRGDSFRSLIETGVEDLLVLDAGVFEKQLTVRSKPAGLVAVDAGTVRIFPQWDGSDQKEPHYGWYPKGVWQASFTNDEMIYIMARPATHRLYGLSPLEILKETIDADLEASQYNKRMVRQTSPPGIINLGEGVGRQQVNEFKTYWQSEIAGKQAVAFIGGTKNPDFIRWEQTNREAQYMQWQIYLVRKICAVFGISAQELNLTFDINKATAEVQQEISEDSGLRPLLGLIEEYLNREFVADFQRIEVRRRYASGEWSGSEYRRALALMALNPRYDNHREAFTSIVGTSKALEEAAFLNLMFQYDLPTGRSLAAEAEYATAALSGLPWHTVNEIRRRQNLDPKPGGDEIIVMTPVGAIPLAMLVGAEPAETEEQKKLLQALLEAPALNLGMPSRTDEP